MTALQPTNLFLYGMLCHPALLELVSGKGWDELAPVAAQCDGYRVVWAKDHGFPLIVEDAQSVAQGIMLHDVSDEVLQRLNHYELGFGYELIDAQVTSPNGPMRAQLYLAPMGMWEEGAAWSLTDWVRDFWPVTRHSAAEVMGYFGVLSGQEIAARFGMILTRAAARHSAEHEESPTAVRSTMGREDVGLVDSNPSHRGFFLLKTHDLRHRRFDGAMSETLKREVFVAGDAATVLPYDPVRDRVMLVEQFRMGPYERGDQHPWVLEPIAGRIDGYETAQATAIREAEEEAALHLHRLIPIAQYYTTPGYSTELIHSFIGIANLPDVAKGRGGLEGEGEDIRSHVVSFADAMALIDSGEANNGPLILSLLWLAQKRETLRQNGL